MTRYQCFDRGSVQLGDVAERGHDLRADDCLTLGPPKEPYADPRFHQLVERIVAARRDDRPVILMMGAHPIKLGLSRFLVDLIDRGVITHLATNGAGIIHDFELATLGGTSENVAKWIRTGKFGLWRETSRLNELAIEAADNDEGLGEAIGRTLEADDAPHRHLSLLAAGWRNKVPVTGHVGIGNDIVHAHPNCNGAAWGKVSDTDFLIFSHAVSQLEGGVFLNVGTAVTGPEVYLKALSMARNVAARNVAARNVAARNVAAQNSSDGQPAEIRHFTTAVFDLVGLPDRWEDGPPSKDHPLYYYRPWKTILHRTVADGGTSFYFHGDHRQTIPTLWDQVANHP